MTCNNPGAAASLLAAHRDRLRALAAERQRLVQHQGDVLRAHVTCGAPLPARAGGTNACSGGDGGVSGDGGGGMGSAAARRSALVEQLAAEEAAARAALDALKQACAYCR
jgi:hypothetical protein